MTAAVPNGVREPGAVVIRGAGIADLDPIMAIERASFPTDAWSSEAMAETLASGDTAAFVAVHDHTVVGYAAALVPEGSGDADVLTIAVRAASRGAGLGRVLLTALTEAAAERGAQRVFLEVRADNPIAQSLYRSAGFVVLGVRPRYYQPDDVDAIVMRLDLPDRRQR